MAAVPALHVVTDDEVLAGPAFRDIARALLEEYGRAIALHVRGHRTPVREVHDLAAALVPVARATGAALLLNDRTDVALAVGAQGVQLGARSLPVAAARRLDPDWVIGVSVHGTDEIARSAGCDFALLGTIWATPSHPDRRGGGPELIRAAAGVVRVPLIAIGGVTPGRAPEALAAGAAGVAAIRGIWAAGDADPVAAAGAYLRAMEREGGARDDGRDDHGDREW